MVLLPEIYCPEQIVIPENFNNVLKLYAKGRFTGREENTFYDFSNFPLHSSSFLMPRGAPAVIRTQPFDLLRWSAAYFRCLALERTPPVKPRYEPELRRGRLSSGALRVLIDQVITFLA